MIKVLQPPSHNDDDVARVLDSLLVLVQKPVLVLLKLQALDLDLKLT